MPTVQTGSSRATNSRQIRPARKRGRTLLRWLAPVVVTAIFGLLLGAAVAATIHVPAVDAVTDYAPALVTKLHDRDGEVYQRYFRENRMLLEEGQVPDVLRHALLAAEDRNFLRHGGIDLAGILRSVARNVSLGEIDQGASTLTMQLAGTLFLDRTQRRGLAAWKRKIAESFHAVELEKRLSKEQILTLYANVMNLGHGNYGFEAASRFYFARPAAELTPEQAALLVAILPRPSDWSPLDKPEFMLQRRNLVLGAMRAEGYLTTEQYEQARQQPLGAERRRRGPSTGTFFAEEVRRYLYSTYGQGGLYGRGLEVHTTLDAAMQEAAEEALRWGLVRLDRIRGWRGAIDHVEAEALEEHSLPSWTRVDLAPGRWVQGLVVAADQRQATVQVADRSFTLGPDEIAWTRRREPKSVLERGDVAWFVVRERADEARTQYLELGQEPELEGAAVLLESSTGAIRALVGGWDYERNEFNRATQAQRQIGSAFKPFVWGAAFEQGYTAADTLFDAPAVFLGADNLASYSPRNFSREYNGIVTLRTGLEKSLNLVAVKLQDMVGTENVIDFTRRSGITATLPPYPSLALGVADVIPLEAAAAYAAIANQGIYVAPYLIERVTTPDGRVLEQHRATASQAMDARVAYLLTHVLRGVVQRGTGAGLSSLPVPIAGKTGTTDSFSDAWFVGFTPRYTLVVWVGFDRKRSIGRNMTGAEAALPIWRRIVERGLEEGWIDAEEQFVAPPGIVFRRVESKTGLLANEGASSTLQEAFITGTEPVREHSARWQRVMELPWYQQRSFYGKPKAGERMPEDIADWTLVQDDDDG
jgi:penicillin-binding protein 1A